MGHGESCRCAARASQSKSQPSAEEIHSQGEAIRCRFVLADGGEQEEKMLFVTQSSVKYLLGVALVFTALATAQIPHKSSAKVPSRAGSVIYVNHRYDFCFLLPQSWNGYSILRSDWTGTIRDDEVGMKGKESGPIITIRHPDWTDVAPRQDIPIMVFTRNQWHSVTNSKLLVSAAPIGPAEIGSNSIYVFALPPRYTTAGEVEFKGTREVVDWIATRPLRTRCNSR